MKWGEDSGAEFAAAEELESLEPRCRDCGCDDAWSCPDGCFWVEPDLCSRCANVWTELDLEIREAILEVVT